MSAGAIPAEPETACVLDAFEFPTGYCIGHFLRREHRQFLRVIFKRLEAAFAVIPGGGALAKLLLERFHKFIVWARACPATR